MPWAVLVELDLTATLAAGHLKLAVLNVSPVIQGWLSGSIQGLGSVTARVLAVGDGRAAGGVCGGASARKYALVRNLLEVWQRRLRVQEFGAETSFYEPGGHSLLAVQVSTRGLRFGSPSTIVDNLLDRCEVRAQRDRAQA